MRPLFPLPHPSSQPMYEHARAGIPSQVDLLIPVSNSFSFAGPDTCQALVAQRNGITELLTDRAPERNVETAGRDKARAKFTSCGVECGVMKQVKSRDQVRPFH